MNLLIAYKLRFVKNKGNMEPKGKCEEYLKANRWKEDIFVPFLIVGGYFRPISINKISMYN